MLQLVGVTMLVLMPICVILTLSMVQEVSYQPTQRVRMMDGLKLMWGNGPFKRLVMAFMIDFDRIEYNHATLHILYRLYPRRRGHGDLHAVFFLPC